MTASLNTAGPTTRAPTDVLYLGARHQREGNRKQAKKDAETTQKLNQHL